MSYQSFCRHATDHTTPLMWLLKDSLQQKLIDLLEAKLRALGCTIHMQTRVQQVLRERRRVVGMTLRRLGGDGSAVPRPQQRVEAAVMQLRLPSLYVGDIVETLGAALAEVQAGDVE